MEFISRIYKERRNVILSLRVSLYLYLSLFQLTPHKSHDLNPRVIVYDLFPETRASFH